MLTMKNARTALLAVLVVPAIPTLWWVTIKNDERMKGTRNA
jgi:hypothetical protein